MTRGTLTIKLNDGTIRSGKYDSWTLWEKLATMRDNMHMVKGWWFIPD